MDTKRIRNPSLRTSFLQLPPELRLKIYEEALKSSNDYTDNPMIIIQNRGNTFTTRGRYRAMSMCPSWEGNDGTARKLLCLNHQIHDETEDFLYSKHTLFFRNSFDLNRIGQFIDTLSSTARCRIRSVGFEVFFFVHAEADVPKRTMTEYENAGRLLAEKLPRWQNVLFYLDPRFYYPSTLAGGSKTATRGVIELANRFGDLCKDITFSPLSDGEHDLLKEAQQVFWRSSSPKRHVGVRGEDRRSVKYSSHNAEWYHLAEYESTALLSAQ